MLERPESYQPKYSITRLAEIIPRIWPILKKENTIVVRSPRLCGVTNSATLLAAAGSTTLDDTPIKTRAKDNPQRGDNHCSGDPSAARFKHRRAILHFAQLQVSQD